MACDSVGQTSCECRAGDGARPRLAAPSSRARIGSAPACSTRLRREGNSPKSPRHPMASSRASPRADWLGMRWLEQRSTRQRRVQNESISAGRKIMVSTTTGWHQMHQLAGNPTEQSSCRWSELLLLLLALLDGPWDRTHTGLQGPPRSLVVTQKTHLNYHTRHDKRNHTYLRNYCG